MFGLWRSRVKSRRLTSLPRVLLNNHFSISGNCWWDGKFRQQRECSGYSWPSANSDWLVINSSFSLSQQPWVATMWPNSTPGLI
jgi:hypothetical protein